MKMNFSRMVRESLSEIGRMRRIRPWDKQKEQQPKQRRQPVQRP